MILDLVITRLVIGIRLDVLGDCCYQWQFGVRGRTGDIVAEIKDIRLSPALFIDLSISRAFIFVQFISWGALY